MAAWICDGSFMMKGPCVTTGSRISAPDKMRKCAGRMARRFGRPPLPCSASAHPSLVRYVGTTELGFGHEESGPSRQYLGLARGEAMPGFRVPR